MTKSMAKPPILMASRAVARRWLTDRASTSGDLGTLALYSLIKSLTDVRRRLHEWLDSHGNRAASRAAAERHSGF